MWDLLTSLQTQEESADAQQRAASLPQRLWAEGHETGIKSKLQGHAVPHGSYQPRWLPRTGNAAGPNRDGRAVSKPHTL